ncbi:swi5-dependent recombination DNA repair protein 1 homolog [Penaeus japonicus]|uniref:swi5-dependent recombination DNA repair protein 1 homolog n=1 Tax=Penaeus japonicus TaxID=27405 RepID=UPI001C7119C5|nr:swi5-dependent recombination DNA repair protein 1 homolog [Penaeus japonicus]
MLTRREVVIEKPFRDRRYNDHRRKVQSALPRIDAGPPREYPHLILKLKKLRLEKDRQGKICEDNIKLVHRMAIIMRTKRLDNINTAPRGPFEPRSAKPRRPPPSRSSDEADGGWARGKSFLEQVTAEVNRYFKPPPPGEVVQHRAPAGRCRVPRVGPPPSSRSPTLRRSPRVPIIKLPISSPRDRRSPSPSPSSRSSASCRRGRETTRLSPLPRLSRRPSICAALPTPADDNSSSAADEDDFEEETEEEDKEKSGEESTEEGNEETERSSDDGPGSRSKSESAGESGEADSDHHVSSILLQQHPSITIDEPSDDDFYN